MTPGKRPGELRSLLTEPGFLRLWAIGGFSNAMRWLELLAAGLLTFAATGSPLDVALVTAARTLPLLLFGALVGVVSEAVDRRRILIGGLALAALSAATVVLLSAAGVLRPWHLACTGFVSGLVWSTEMSTRRRMVGEIAGSGLVSRAIALDSVTNASTRMVGPLLGGIAYQWVGMTGAFALSATLYCASLALAAGFRHRQDTRPLRLGQVPADLAEGLAFAVQHPVVLGVVGITVAMNLFGFSYSALVAPLGQVHFHVSPALVGALAAAEPLGSLIGGLLLTRGDPRMERRRLFAGGTILFLATVIAMPFAPVFGLACGLLVLGGLGTSAFGNMQSTLMLTEAPPAMRSRLMGLITVGIGTGPLGVLMSGALADRFGAAAAVQIMALLGIIVTAAVVAAWSGMEHRQRAASASSTRPASGRRRLPAE